MLVARPVVGADSVGETGQIVERTGDEPLPARVTSIGGGGKKLDQVPRARCCLSAGRRWDGEKTILKLLLAISQRRLVNLNLANVPANLSIPLSRHPAVVV